jgi:hypothetical protein
VNPEPQKKPRRFWILLGDGVALIAGWGIILYLVVFHFSRAWLTGLLHDLADFGLPLSIVAGLFLMLAAHASRSTTKRLDEAYPLMRGAALSLLLGFILLWLRRHL